MFPTLILFAIGLQAASPAAPATTGYVAAMEQGRSAYDGFALADARKAFERAIAFATNDEDRATAIVWLGALQAENGDFDGARVRFREALAYDARVAVSVNLSPAIHTVMEEERAQHMIARREAQEILSYQDPALSETPRWALLSGGAVAAVGVLALGGGAMVGLAAVTQRDAASSQAFQSTAVSEYQKAREGVLWSNVLYGAGSILVAAGGGLAVASAAGVDAP